MRLRSLPVARMPLRTLWFVLAAGDWALAPHPGGARAKEEFLPPPPAPDREFYVKHIAPFMEAHCAVCHRRGGGTFRMVRLDAGLNERMRRHADFERVLSFVKRTAPWESRLYLKILAVGEGGDEHVGGSFFSTEDDEHDTMLDFLSGATLTNLVPEVWFEKQEIRAKPREKVILDGRGSFDRDREDMDKLTFWWELYARPAESAVTVQDRRASRLVFEPDTGGSYVFFLRVGDGKVWSAPRPVTIEVFDHVEVKRKDPGGISGLEKTEVELLRRVRRLYLDILGRSPTPAEAIAEERSGPKKLVKNILLRSESGRAWVEALQVRLGLIGDYRPMGDDATKLALRIPAESLTPVQVEGTLARDPAFLRRHPPGRALAEAIARLLLDRAATPDEIRAAAELAAGRPTQVPGVGPVQDSRDWLIRVLDSQAFGRAAMRRRLERFLDSGDAANPLGRGLLAAKESNKVWRSFLESVLVDPRYLDRRRLRPKDDVTFLRSLFVDLLERKPTDRELTALVRAVQTMPGESAAFAAVVRVMIDSGEAPIPLLVDIYDAPRWITDRFLRYLGRRPSAAEMDAYGKTLLHPQGGPELVIQALMTGPEYACR